MRYTLTKLSRIDRTKNHTAGFISSDINYMYSLAEQCNQIDGHNTKTIWIVEEKPE